MFTLPAHMMSGHHTPVGGSAPSSPFHVHTGGGAGMNQNMAAMGIGSPIRLIPASEMMPTSPFSGIQTFYITVPMPAEQQHQQQMARPQQQQQQQPQQPQGYMDPSSLLFQHAAAQAVVNGGSPYRQQPQFFTMAPPSQSMSPASHSGDGSQYGYYPQQVPSASMPHFKPPPLAQHQPMMQQVHHQHQQQQQQHQHISPLTIVTTTTTSSQSTTTGSNSPPMSALVSNSTTASSGEQNMKQRLLSPIRCALLTDDEKTTCNTTDGGETTTTRTMVKEEEKEKKNEVLEETKAKKEETVAVPRSILEPLPRTVTSKAIETLVVRLNELINECTWQLPAQPDLLKHLYSDEASQETLTNSLFYIIDVAIFVGLRLIKLLLPVDVVREDLWSVLWKNRVCYLGADVHQMLITHTFEMFSLKPHYGYSELLDELIGRFHSSGGQDLMGGIQFDRKLMNRVVRLFLKASCLRKFRENEELVMVARHDQITSAEEFRHRHDTTIVRLLLIEGFHFEAEEFADLLSGDNGGGTCAVDTVLHYVEGWYSNFSLAMCLDDLQAARERSRDPFRLDRFCDEMDAFRLYCDGESATPITILNSLQSLVNMMSIVRNEKEWAGRPLSKGTNYYGNNNQRGRERDTASHNNNNNYSIRAKRTIKKPYAQPNLLQAARTQPQPQHQHQQQGQWAQQRPRAPYNRAPPQRQQQRQNDYYMGRVAYGQQQRQEHRGGDYDLNAFFGGQGQGNGHY